MRTCVQVKEVFVYMSAGRKRIHKSMYRNVDILILWRVSFHSEKFPPKKMYVEIMLPISFLSDL